MAPQATYEYYNLPSYKSFFIPDSLRKKNYDSYVYSRKPGPKDGWNGLTLKILNYIAKRNGCSIKDLCNVFNIARQNIHYHIHKLLKLGLIERWPANAKKHNPYVIYVICCRESSPFFLNGSPLNGLNSSKKAPALKILQILSIKPQTPKNAERKAANQRKNSPLLYQQINQIRPSSKSRRKPLQVCSSHSLLKACLLATFA